MDMKKQVTLKEFIDEKNISQLDAAYQIGISRPHLNQILNARSFLSFCFRRS